jgi:HSP20 family protein
LIHQPTLIDVCDECWAILRYGSFRRSFKLPAHVTSDAISASYDAGLLTVRVAGAHKGAEAQRIAIES